MLETIAQYCFSGIPLPPSGGGATPMTHPPCSSSPLSLSSPLLLLAVVGGLRRSWGLTPISCIRSCTNGVRSCSRGLPPPPLIRGYPPPPLLPAVCLARSLLGWCSPFLIWFGAGHPLSLLNDARWVHMLQFGWVPPFLIPMAVCWSILRPGWGVPLSPPCARMLHALQFGGSPSSSSP